VEYVTLIILFIISTNVSVGVTDQTGNRSLSKVEKTNLKSIFSVFNTTSRIFLDFSLLR
jgi:hypothetical protein